MFQIQTQFHISSSSPRVPLSPLHTNPDHQGPPPPPHTHTHQSWITKGCPHFFSAYISRRLCKFPCCTMPQTTDWLTFHMQFTAALGHAVWIAGHNFVVTAVSGESLSHHQGAAVTFKQQLDVLRLLDGLVILQPDHLQHSSCRLCDLFPDKA